MPLTDDQAMLLRQVAKGSPMGRLLRRYWHPVATSSDLTLEKPTKRVRVLAESLVLFKDRAGRSALIPERCPHDGASMLAGRVTDHGIRCLLHGWFFDSERMCSVWEDDSVQATGYPVREHAGLYWGCLGAEPAPELPVCVALSGPDARRRIVVYPPIRGHWLLEGRYGLDPWRHFQRLTQGEARQPKAEICATNFERS